MKRTANAFCAKVNVRRTANALCAKENNGRDSMLRKPLAIFLTLTLSNFLACFAQQQPQRFQLMRQPVRGTHGAIAAGSEYATEAGMREYYRGGNAVDVGVAALF